MDKGTSSENNFTLNSLLDDYNVVIPVIQRDYAQGRSGCENIRREIITDIYKALGSNNQELCMDFVYGESVKINEKETFYPLDGQQRLTTLWLIHWYLLFRRCSLMERIQQPALLTALEKFSYQTREESKYFFKNLCELDKFYNLCIESV